MNNLTEAKKKEWYGWGKEAHKSCTSTMRNNKHHPDYDAPEKREAVHEMNERGEGENAYNFTENGRETLKTKWNYSDEAIEEAKAEWTRGYASSRKWYSREDKKQQAVLDKYQEIFNEASRIASAVDVSDLTDGFPCGSAHLYLQDYAEAQDLRNALRHFSNHDSDQYMYMLPVTMPNYGQCISFDERICGEVRDFLRTKGIFASIHSWID